MQNRINRKKRIFLNSISSNEQTFSHSKVVFFLYYADNFVHTIIFLFFLKRLFGISFVIYMILLICEIVLILRKKFKSKTESLLDGTIERVNYFFEIFVFLITLIYSLLSDIKLFQLMDYFITKIYKNGVKPRNQFVSIFLLLSYLYFVFSTQYSWIKFSYEITFCKKINKEYWILFDELSYCVSGLFLVLIILFMFDYFFMVYLMCITTFAIFTILIPAVIFKRMKYDDYHMSKVYIYMLKKIFNYVFMVVLICADSLILTESTKTNLGFTLFNEALKKKLSNITK